MTMVKCTQWVLLMIGIVVVPLLKQLIPGLKTEAAKTETEIDDSLVGAFEVVVQALESGQIFIAKAKWSFLLFQQFLLVYGTVVAQGQMRPLVALGFCIFVCGDELHRNSVDGGVSSPLGVVC